MNYGYYGTIGDFININSIEDWLQIMKINYKNMTCNNVSKEEENSWRDTYNCIIQALKDCTNKKAKIIFEYLLPNEGGLRADLIILNNNNIFIFEFKKRKYWYSAERFQVQNYATKLKYFHELSKNKVIIPYLILTESNTKKSKQESSKFNDDVIIMSRSELKLLLITILNGKECIDNKNWINGKYSTATNIYKAIPEILDNKEFYYFNKRKSENIKTVERYINQALDYNNDKNIIVFITGVPGSGKTLLGIDLAHKVALKYNCHSRLVSSNKYLVKILQHCAYSSNKESSQLIKPLAYLISKMEIKNNNGIKENIIVIDEAQRLWNNIKTQENNSIYEKGKSQQEILLENLEISMERKILICLIGEKQEIYDGELNSLENWKKSLEKVNQNWLIYVSPKIKELPKSNNIRVMIKKYLNLNVSYRVPLYEDINRWIDTFIDTPYEVGILKKITKDLENKFDILYTRDLEIAKEFLNKLLIKNNKQAGIISTSSNSIQPLKNVIIESTNNLIWWFYKDPNDENLKHYCNSFNYLVNDYQIQGLELDYVIISWGNDMYFNYNKWSYFTNYNEYKNVEGYQNLIKNRYRVLLSRAREKIILYVPENNDKVNYNRTIKYFEKIGIKKVDNIKNYI